MPEDEEFNAGMEALGIEALGAVERGGYGTGPVPVGKLRVSMIGGGYGTGPVLRIMLVVSVPERRPWLLLIEPGAVPVGTGSDELSDGTTPLLGAVENGG